MIDMMQVSATSGSQHIESRAQALADKTFERYGTWA
jgi:hypothetical protein